MACLRLLIACLSAHALLFSVIADPGQPNANAKPGKGPPKRGGPAKPPARKPRPNPRQPAKKPLVYRKNSFEPPFDDYNSKGDRKIDGWVVGGDAYIMENYIRIANDRASKRGWMYNTALISNKKWTLEMKFRISGQGERLYGDGLALWVTSTSRADYNRGGSLFGAPNKLSGFGVLFDTYKNSETGSLHKDVMLIAGDGSKEIEMHSVISTGCNSNYRMWEKRDDFSPSQFSIAVIEFDAQIRTLKVRIKEESGRPLKDCFEYTFPESGPEALGDLSRMHLAISSSTGQLADNHDVLSVQLREFGDKTAGTIEGEINPDTLGLRVSPDVMKYVKAQMALLEAKLSEMDHDVEHKLDAIGDTLTAATEKIKNAEKEDRKRIEALEAKITKNVLESTEEQMEEMVEEMVDEMVDDKLEEHADDISEAIMEEVEETAKKAADEATTVAMKDVPKGSGWVMPFIVLSAAMCTVTYVAWTKWRQLMKSHLP